MKVPDDYAVGIGFCCAGSVLLVMTLYLGLWGFADDLVPLIAISIILHVVGLMMVVINIIISRWRTEAAKYYDWGL